MRYYFFALLYMLIFCNPVHGNHKIVALLPIRNEQIMITQCLKALKLYADAIIILDDYSTDNTLEIVASLTKECKVEKIITKSSWYRDEPGDRNALLEAGRETGGTHFIVIDADEMFTANCLKNNKLRKHILALKPGESIALNWIQLWRSIDKYRYDSSVWTNNYKPVIFCDDGISLYESGFIHTARIPHGINKQTYRINDNIGLLHFQFVSWQNLLIKQAWYRCLEHIRNPNRPISEINFIYGQSKDEKSIGFKPCPVEWFQGYDFFNPVIFSLPEIWRKKQVNEWFKQYGKNFFKELDIWDVNWEE